MNPSALKTIPRLRELPLLGSALPFKNKRLELLKRIARECGEIGAFRVAHYDFALVNSPRLCPAVLIDNFEDYDGGPRAEHIGALLGPNSFGLLLGEEHKKHRKFAAPAFQYRRVLTDYTPHMAAFSRDFERSLKDGSELDVSEAMKRLILRIVAKTLLDVDNFELDEELSAALKVCLAYVEYLTVSIFPAPLSWPTPRNRRFLAARDLLRSRVKGFIEKARAERNDRGGFLSIMLSARDENGVGLDDLQLRDHVLTAFVGGYDTTTHTLTWLWYQLMKNPEVYARVKHEVDTVLQGRLVTAEDLPRLGYTLQVLKETLRMYPAGYILARRAVKDIAVGEYVLRKGQNALVSPYTLHRNPDVFPDPERFDPDRFEPEREKQLPRHAYLPFGVGPHVCIGMHFALVEMQLVVASMVQGVHLELLPGPPVKEVILGSLRPSPFRARVQRRG